jgi:hypothetical protein
MSQELDSIDEDIEAAITQSWHGEKTYKHKGEVIFLGNVSGGNQLRVYTMETSILSTDLASDGSLYRWVILTY